MINNTLFNDPVYGFISIPDGIIFKLVEHPYFQRLRRIKQLGLTNLVYPGAQHTRFHHAIGTMHLMQQALETIRSKGHQITAEEEQGVLIAILLHDIGHGPFSHTLEHSIVKNVSHEDISLLFMNALNKEFNGELSLAIEIFTDQYEKKFLHQLVSSQLDMDRLDYLKRDSFYCGVEDGEISSERIIKTLNIVDDQLCIEAKGIYSVENFIVARMNMYWQVYLHKTVISAEFVLVKILKRAREIVSSGTELFSTPGLRKFIYNTFTIEDFQQKEILNDFAHLDDFDIMAAVKDWANHEDKILSTLSSMLLNRKLFKIDIQNEPIDAETMERYKQQTIQNLDLSDNELDYFFFTNSITNKIYNVKHEQIKILYKDGIIKNFIESSNLLRTSSLPESIKKFFICHF